MDDIFKIQQFTNVPCPNCGTMGFAPALVAPQDNIRDYSFVVSSKETSNSYRTSSPVRIGDSFEELKRKMVGYNHLQSIEDNSRASISGNVDHKSFLTGGAVNGIALRPRSRAGDSQSSRREEGRGGDLSPFADLFFQTETIRHRNVTSASVDSSHEGTHDPTSYVFALAEEGVIDVPINPSAFPLNEESKLQNYAEEEEEHDVADIREGGEKDAKAGEDDVGESEGERGGAGGEHRDDREDEKEIQIEYRSSNSSKNLGVGLGRADSKELLLTMSEGKIEHIESSEKYHSDSETKSGGLITAECLVSGEDMLMEGGREERKVDSTQPADKSPEAKHSEEMHEDVFEDKAVSDARVMIQEFKEEKSVDGDVEHLPSQEPEEGEGEGEENDNNFTMVHPSDDFGTDGATDNGSAYGDNFVHTFVMDSSIQELKDENDNEFDGNESLFSELADESMVDVDRDDAYAYDNKDVGSETALGAGSDHMVKNPINDLEISDLEASDQSISESVLLDVHASLTDIRIQ